MKKYETLNWECYLCERNPVKYKIGDDFCVDCMRRIDSLRSYNHSMLSASLKKNYKSSLFNFLPYSLTDLRFHIENQFLPWMNWNNNGRYIKNAWDDNNYLTWSWQIDHIIPKSKFIYTSPLDEDFLKCWQLDNLRPYPAKLNILKGHK